ncbi:hypothetical protein NPIL_667201 [Nephila pilipes]|uniref:Uncharacterized protein n=1 Tax=Nephila pilipes TaxID=299642 RepID=A0A8X6NRK3_NEPPI|nr:hypothetical protein NPIL_667201 [Nephila pilipes]
MLSRWLSIDKDKLSPAFNTLFVVRIVFVSWDLLQNCGQRQRLRTFPDLVSLPTVRKRLSFQLLIWLLHSSCICLYILAPQLQPSVHLRFMAKAFWKLLEHQLSLCWCAPLFFL